MLDTKEKRKSKFLLMIKAHPFNFSAAVFLLVLGLTSGVSTNAAVYRSSLLTNVFLSFENGLSYHVLNGFLRAVCVNLILYGVITISRTCKLLYPVSLACLALKGFLIGFAIRSFFFEYGAIGMLWWLLIFIPGIMTMSGMVLGFLRNSKTAFTKNKSKGKGRGKIKEKRGVVDYIRPKRLNAYRSNSC